MNLSRKFGLALAVAAVAGGALRAQGEEPTAERKPAIDSDTMEAFWFGDGFAGKVSAEMASEYCDAKAQVLKRNGGRFVVAEELANEETWPEIKFSADAAAGPVTLRVVFLRDGGEEAPCTNVVGFVKRTLPAGKMQLLSLPYRNLESRNEAWKFGDTKTADGLPQGASVLFWNEADQTWSGGTKTVRGWGSALSNRTIEIGEAFFVQNNSREDIEVTICGEVPGAATRSRNFAAGKWSVLAAPYPVDGRFKDTEVASAAPQGSEVLFWDVENQGWSGGAKSAKGWAAGQADEIVEAGGGFFLRSGNGGTWEAAKPYEWP